MASAAGYDIFYIITTEMLPPEGEAEDSWASEPQTLNQVGLSGFQEEGQARKVVWLFARISCRSSVKGNC